MRWRIEEYFLFKKQQYDFGDFRVRSLNSIRTLHRILTLLAGLVGLFSEKRDQSVFVMELITVSRRIYRTKPEKPGESFSTMLLVTVFLPFCECVPLELLLFSQYPSLQTNIFIFYLKMGKLKY